MKTLVTGSTGYIGGRLIPRLLKKGHQVVVFARNPAHLQGRPWREQVEVVQGDLLDPNSFNIPDDITLAYYLVHSMSGSSTFAADDARAARNFLSKLPKGAHVIYLGGISPEGGNPSAHLASRMEVGNLLREAAPTTELRAGPIIGSGSASFEMVRNLTERLPIMIAPKWVRNRVRPIAIRDILQYLLLSADKRPEGHFDVGSEPIAFIDMMKGWAEVRGLRRLIIPVPLLAPRLAARWIGWVTPISNRIAIPLVEGMLHSIVGDTDEARRRFPEIKPISYQQAVKLAREKIESDFIETRWSGASHGSSSVVLEEREGIIHETRTLNTTATPERVFRTFCSAGGRQGWFAWNWAWHVRGIIDLMIGGPGLRRGRRHPTEIFPGETIDFWRVEAVETDHLLRLRAEMKVPGKAWLEWRVRPNENGSQLTQTAFFNAKGIMGRLYWVVLYPIHSWIFSDMIKAVVRKAESGDARKHDK